ncbi:MAG: asparagine synthase C-terminal domain-containing protein, partial [Verrucomicrobia bacterium]|nr:asparagine synthase C-terminal domain-containing protein [Verrucomicrobiota bacterium]
DAGLDESQIAKRTADHFGSTHHEMRLTTSLGREIFEKFLTSVDQPSIDGFNTYVVSSLAREVGAKVVLSGLGGDELFGGYSSFWKIPALLKACHAIQAIPFAGAITSKILRSRMWSPRLRRVGALLKSPVSIREAYRSYRGIYLVEEAQKLAMHATGATDKEASYTGLAAGASDPLNAVSELELTFYMRNQLLRDSDVMSMAHGLELRVPLVDAGLFHAIARLPAAVRIQQGKQLLAEAVPEIPAWVIEQPKRGFVFPFADWMETPQWKPVFDNAMKNLPVPAVAWYQRWSVFMFHHWCRSVGIH